MPDNRKDNLTEPTQSLYIDFWEGCDSDTLQQNGFFLIGSENLPVTSVCFLCGSAGKHSMIFCSLCCESYHRFCLDQTKLTILSLSASSKQYNWICPKCVFCDKCNQLDRQKVACQKCLKAFHPECHNLQWDKGKKQLVSKICFCFLFYSE